MNKVKVALMGACTGVGGADALMNNLIRYCYNIEFTGVVINDEISESKWEWTRRFNNHHVPYYTKDTGLRLEGVNYTSSIEESIKVAIKGADLVLTWGVHLSEYLKKIINIPIIEYCQNSDNWYKRLMANNCPYTDYHVACAYSAIKTYPEQVREKVKVIYNGIEPSRVTPGLGRVAQRKLWGLESKKIILFAGRFVPEKNPEALIQLISKLPEDYVGIFCGSGILKEQLGLSAARYTPNRIFFIDTQFFLGDVFAASDLFILPTDFEGLPLAWCEAILSGLPTIITNIPVVKELELRFGKIATTVSTRPTTEELVAATQEAMKCEVVGHARQVVWDNLTISTVARQWEDYFYKVRDLSCYKNRRTFVLSIQGQKPFEDEVR